MSSKYYTYFSSPFFEQSLNTIKTLNDNGDYLGNIISPGEGNLFGPDGLTINPANQNLYVGTVIGSNVLSYKALTGEFVNEFVSSNNLINAFNGSPIGIAPDTPLRSTPLPEGTLKLKDTYGQLGSITGITFGPNGNLYVSNFESLVGIASSSSGQPIIHFDVQDSILEYDGVTGELVRSIPLPIDNGSTAPVPEGIVNFDSGLPTLPSIRDWLSKGNIPNASLPLILTFGPDGNLYIPAGVHNTVYRYNPNTGDLTSFIKAPFPEVESEGLNGPAGLVFFEDSWYITSLFNNQVLRYDADGNFSDVFVNFNTSGLQDIMSGPTAIRVTPDGESFILTGFNSTSTIEINSKTGELTKVLTGPGGNPTFGYLRNSGLLIATPEEIGGTIVSVDIKDEPSVVSSRSSFPITVEFSEDVANFEIDDIIVENGTTDNLTAIDGNTYTANIIPDGNGNITIDIPSGVVSSNTGNTNIAVAEKTSVIVNTNSLYVSNVNNTGGVGSVVYITFDDNGNIASASPNFEVGVYYSSILEYDAITGDFLGEFVPQGSANRDGIYFSSGITFRDNILYANDQGFQVNSSVTNPEDTLYGRILKFDATTGQYLGEFISGMDLTANGLNFPEDLLFGTDGDLYISGLGGGGVQKFDGTTGAYEETIVSTNPFTGTDLIAAGLNFGPDGNLYISSVLNDNSILRYNLDSKTVEQFVPSEIAPQIPSGSTFTPDGSLFLDATFVSLDGSPVGVFQYNGETGADEGFFVDPSNNGGMQSASRMRFDKLGNLYISDFNGSQIMKFDSAGNPVNGGVFVASDVGGLYNPGGLAFAPASDKRFDILSAQMYRFRNTSYETGSYLFVGKEERDNILANPEYNQIFVLESESPAFEVSFEPADDLLPFYRLQSLERSGQYLFVGQGEYDQIFAENSDQRDKWVGEGLDREGNDQPDFYTYGAGADQGSSFNRFRNNQNGTYLFAGVGESENIVNDPSLSNIFDLEGVAFESIF